MARPNRYEASILQCMKTPLRILFTLLLFQIAFVVPCRATDVVTIYDKFKKDTLAAPDPEYPMKSKNLGYQGQGIYRPIIKTRPGLADEVKILKQTGHRKFDPSAFLTFMKWKFR